MAKSMYAGSNQPTARYSDVRDEPVNRLLSPIKGYQAAPIVVLEEALVPISHHFNDIVENAWIAKQNCEQPEEGLTLDESASIHLYTMQFDGSPSLFDILNHSLRAENRQNLEEWYLYLKLFLTALYKLPSHAQTVWRGVRNVDLSSAYPKGKKLVWWGVSSCTTNVEVLNNKQFLGDTGVRTIFSIECRNGKDITRHSYFKNIEEEVILMPGSYFEVIGQLSPASGLHIIQLKEIDPPFPFLKPPFAKSDLLVITKDTAPIKQAKPPASSVASTPSGNVPPPPQAKFPHSNSATTAKPLAPTSSASKFVVQAAAKTTVNDTTAVKLNVPYTSPDGKFKVINCDMSLWLQQQFISVIMSAVDEGGVDSQIASRIKKAIDKQHTLKWHCIVGTGFASYVTYNDGNFLYVKYDKKTVLLWTH